MSIKHLKQATYIRICCFSLINSFVGVHEESVGFGPLNGQKSNLRTSFWVPGNNNTLFFDILWIKRLMVNVRPVVNSY